MKPHGVPPSTAPKVPELVALHTRAADAVAAAKVVVGQARSAIIRTSGDRRARAHEIHPPASATPAVDDLSPRLRQTLHHLLAGANVKRAAAEMHISPHTVHLYVTALYRHYAVNSHAELIAKFLGRKRPPAIKIAAHPRR